jgi:hypothetical protein
MFAFFVLIFLVNYIFETFGLSSTLLAAIEALSTALAVATVFGAGYFAVQELSEASKSRYLEISDKLFNELNSKENIEARRIVYGLRNKNSDENLSQEQREAIKKVLNSLDRVAFLTQKGWIPDDIIMPWMHPMIAKSWVELEPYVLQQRQQRGEPYYYQHAGELADRCLVWRKKNNIAENKVKYIKENAI